MKFRLLLIGAIVLIVLFSATALLEIEVKKVEIRRLVAEKHVLEIQIETLRAREMTLASDIKSITLQENLYDQSVYFWDYQQLFAKNRVRFEPKPLETKEFLTLGLNGDNQVEYLYRFNETPVIFGLDEVPIYPNAIKGETIHLEVNNVGLMTYTICPTNRSYCRLEEVVTNYFPFPP